MQAHARTRLDMVDEEKHWKVLRLYGCPEKVVQITKFFHEGMSGALPILGNISEVFTINHGVKQNCVLVLTLFTLYLATVLEFQSPQKSVPDDKVR